MNVVIPDCLLTLCDGGTGPHTVSPLGARVLEGIQGVGERILHTDFAKCFSMSFKWPLHDLFSIFHNYLPAQILHSRRLADRENDSLCKLMLFFLLQKGHKFDHIQGENYCNGLSWNSDMCPHRVQFFFQCMTISIYEKDE